MEEEIAPNAAFQELLDAIQAEEMEVPPGRPPNISSNITFSVNSPEGGSSNDSVNNMQLVIHGMAVDAEVSQVNVPLGDGLNNIFNAYQDLDAMGEEEDNGMVDDMREDEIIPNNLNLQPPEVAHLMLGRVETFFFPVPEEHNLFSRFSKHGLELWEKFFAPNLLPLESHGGSKVHQIPVSWFNYVTLMLMSPEKFDWAKEFLSSQLWEIIQEPIISEPTAFLINVLYPRLPLAYCLITLLNFLLLRIMLWKWYLPREKGGKARFLWWRQR
jgi:hypothetical protein